MAKVTSTHNASYLLEKKRFDLFIYLTYCAGLVSSQDRSAPLIRQFSKIAGELMQCANYETLQVVLRFINETDFNKYPLDSNELGDLIFALIHAAKVYQNALTNAMDQPVAQQLAQNVYLAILGTL